MNDQKKLSACKSSATRLQALLPLRLNANIKITVDKIKEAIKPWWIISWPRTRKNGQREKVKNNCLNF